MRANARSADGDPASTPTNLEISPPAVDMPASSLALSSGAVSSSWMSKRLMSVFTVIWLVPLPAWNRHPVRVFTLLLASYLPVVSYSAGTADLRSRPGAFDLDYVGEARVGSVGPPPISLRPRGGHRTRAGEPHLEPPRIDWRTGWPIPKSCEPRPRTT